MQCKCYKLCEGYIEFNLTQRKKLRETKNSFRKRIDRKCGHVKTCIEQNNDHNLVVYLQPGVT